MKKYLTVIVSTSCFIIRKTIFKTLLLVFTGNIIFAQENTICAVDYVFPVEDVSLFSQTANSNSYCFNTYVYVIRNDQGEGGVTEEQVDKMFIKLRKAFDPLGISFSWDNSITYINSNAQYNNDIPIGLSLLGLNHDDGIDIVLYPLGYPDNGGLASAIDGITAMAIFGINEYGDYGPMLETNVTVHEMGHVFGLNHTHGNFDSEPELVNGSNCMIAGDGFCDTPADPNMNYMVSDGCEFNSIGITDANEQTYDPDEKNFMSYSTPQCISSFSGEQINFMKNYIDGTGKFQNTLINSSTDPNNIPFSSSLTVNSSIVKNNNEVFNGDIIVNSDLTIEDCIIELTEGHRIIVNQGASLIIRNAILRTYTGALCYNPMEGKTEWEGIEVMPGVGNFTDVAVYTNSTLESSESGIYNPDGTSGFLNLAFNNSTLHGPAIDLSNTFGIQRLLKSNFDHTVNVTDNFHLKVEGCSFDFPMDSQESGIKALNTHLAVVKAYNGPNTTFTNCSKGIEFISSSAQSIRVSNTDFNKVLSGIDAKSVAGFLTFHDCTVEMRDPSGTLGFGTGLLIDNFIDFEVYNNDINGSGSSVQEGVEIKNAGLNDNPNLVINNTIDGCFKGILSTQAELGNMTSGVEFECNTFHNIANDNFHTSKIGPQQGRGGEVEGVPARPAGNKFDGTTIGFQDFNYEGGGWGPSQVKTYHYRDVGLENIQNYNDGSQATGFAVFETNLLTGGEVPQCTYPVVNNDPNPLPTAVTIRKNLLDNGDTGGSVNIVKTNSDTNPTSVLTEILGDSPWVSIPVVQTLFEYSQYYTEAQIAQVLVQNPGVLDDEYIYYLAFESGSFSQMNQQAMIQAFQNGDARIDFENGLVDDIRNGTLHIKNTFNNEADNQTFDQATIRTSLNDKMSYTKLYQIVESYLLENDYSGALNALSAKMDFDNFDPHLAIEKAKYTDLIQMESSLHAQGKDWSKVSSYDFNRLNTIATNYYGVATVKARNILEIYHGLSFGTFPPKPTYSPLSFIGSSPRSSQEDKSGAKVYPNPVQQKLNIDLDVDTGSFTFKLIRLDGKVIRFETLNGAKNTIDLSVMDKGVYLYEIILTDQTKFSNKLIIIE